MRISTWFGALSLLVSLLVPSTVLAQTLAEGNNFTTPYFSGATTIAINDANVPSKLYANPVFGGHISRIIPIFSPNSPAYYLVIGNILYVTGHSPGYMHFQIEETLPDGRKILSQPVLFAFYRLRVTTPEACQGYDSSSHFAAISPVSPLRLNIVTEPAGIDPKFYVGLIDPSLGNVQGPYPNSTFGQEISVNYVNNGSTTLQIWQLNPQNTPLVLYSLPLDFLAEKEVNLNLYFVRDAKGYAPQKLSQRAMTGYMQDAERILNQAGIRLNIARQEELYIPESLGRTIDAYSEGISPEEEAVLSQAVSGSNDKYARHRDTNEVRYRSGRAINIFLVWDYSIDGQATVGVNFETSTLGKVIFVGDRTYKPGETLAHEIGHALGLEHNNLAQSFLMSPNEYGNGTQCALARSEWNTMNANA
ncbi:MAG: hypothetical protein A2V81_04255 [Candidatus Abawacabacteria bacterium RBG_16_42_10]|uniref:Peptidase M10 metallopeptidase domain-containing protein n=1 Tax=Candidatus Abawacabacteria bacterium RBG_16_42_10 TaxID=1817814 RepID=A0A1F4XI83_9BACT|nr:MAG: hypothetical protein A2V81_04255 [Candidatus Abawacabacteria bacterium RBG_16_42_10]